MHVRGEEGLLGKPLVLALARAAAIHTFVLHPGASTPGQTHLTRKGKVDQHVLESMKLSPTLPTSAPADYRRLKFPLG